jgi:hypothetical protein
MECRSCENDLDHCHGTLIAHEDGTTECTGACADGDPARHRLRLTCDGVDGGCGCTAEPAAQLALAR